MSTVLTSLPESHQSAASIHHSTCFPNPLACAAKRLSVAVIGASISAGTGAEDAPSWVDRLQTYLQNTYGRHLGANVTLHNGAVPGTTSHYMSGCVNLHVPEDSDIIFLDYAINDPAEKHPMFDNDVRQATLCGVMPVAGFGGWGLRGRREWGGGRMVFSSHVLRLYRSKESC